MLTERSHVWGPPNDEVNAINALMESMQENGINCGGMFHFSWLAPSPGHTTHEKIVNLLTGIPAYTDPYVTDPRDGKQNLVTDRELKNLKLLPVENLAQTLLEKCEEWGKMSHYHSRVSVSPAFDEKRDLFMKTALLFLERQNIQYVFTVDGIDTFYSFGQDHMNDDLLIDTLNGIYVVHFGLSS